MNDNGWVSAHIYHDELDPVLVKVVRPLVAEWAAGGLARGHFFVRYWEGGRHLRLRVRPAGGAAEAIRTGIRQSAEAFFRQRPAPDRSPDHMIGDYLAVAARLARWEHRSDYQCELQPSNSVVFEPYEQEYERYGGEAAMPAVEEHFVQSSRIALAMVCAGLAAQQRHLAAVGAIMLTWLAVGAERDRLLAIACMPPAEVPDAPERYRRHAAALARLAGRLRPMAAESAEPLGDRSLPEWLRSVTTLSGRLGATADAHGVLSSCTHMFCNRLGIGLRNEMLLRYLAARALLGGTDGAGETYAVV